MSSRSGQSMGKRNRSYSKKLAKKPFSHCWYFKFISHLFFKSDFILSSPGNAPRQAVGNDTHHRGERLGSKEKDVEDFFVYFLGKAQQNSQVCESIMVSSSWIRFIEVDSMDKLSRCSERILRSLAWNTQASQLRSHSSHKNLIRLAAGRPVRTAQTVQQVLGASRYHPGSRMDVVVAVYVI